MERSKRADDTVGIVKTGSPNPTLHSVPVHFRVMESGLSCHHCSPTLSSGSVKSSPRTVLSMKRRGPGIYLQGTILHLKVKESFNQDKEAEA